MVSKEKLKEVIDILSGLADGDQPGPSGSQGRRPPRGVSDVQGCTLSSRPVTRIPPTNARPLLSHDKG